MYETSPGERRVLMATSRAPVMGTPKWASSMAGTLGSSAATRSPGSTPARHRAPARARQRSANSP